jgi:hypothetical protein
VPPCHGGGRGFKSRQGRKLWSPPLGGFVTIGDSVVEAL